jgi:hypothetical protein
MPTQSAPPRKENTAREREAADSAGRAAGYCYVQRIKGPGRCTFPPRHAGRHRDFYEDVDFD